MSKEIYNDIMFNSQKYEDDDESSLNKFINPDILKKKNGAVPKRPKKGEYIVCQWCGKPLLPEELSKDIEVRRKEIKWHHHERCRLQVIGNLDKNTPGLITERRMFEKRAKALEEANKPKAEPRRRSFLEMSTKRR